LALGLNTLVMGLIFGALASEFEGPLSLIHGAIWIWVVLLPAMLVSGLVARRFAVRLGLRAPSRSAWWREAALGLLIFGPYWLVTRLRQSASTSSATSESHGDWHARARCSRSLGSPQRRRWRGRRGCPSSGSWGRPWRSRS